MDARVLMAALAALTVFPSLPAEKPGPAPATYTKNVAIVLYEGVELLDFAGPGEVFSAAAGFGSDRGQPAFRVYTVAATKAPLHSQGWLMVQPEFSIDDAPRPDIVVIPGGSSGNLTSDPKFMAWATGEAAKSRILLTVCTGAFVPAKAGMLDGLHVTTWFGALDRLRSATPKADVQPGRRFIDNGQVITTAGVSAGIDGALHLVARLAGRYVADRTARYMEYHWTPEPYLAQAYMYLNPGLDERGRARQQAAIDEDEHHVAAALAAWEKMTKDDPSDTFAWYQFGRTLQLSGRYDDAIAAHRHAATSAELRPEALFNIGCALAKSGHTDDAIAALEQAAAAGFRQKWAYTGDDDLESVRDDPRFKKLVATL